MERSQTTLQYEECPILLNRNWRYGRFRDPQPTSAIYILEYSRYGEAVVWRQNMKQMKTLLSNLDHLELLLK